MNRGKYYYASCSASAAKPSDIKKNVTFLVDDIHREWVVFLCDVDCDGVAICLEHELEAKATKKLGNNDYVLSTIRDLKTWN